MNESIKISVFLGVELDSPCDFCRGEGRYALAGRHRDEDCEVCDGTGYHLNEAGQALLAFMERHSKRLGLNSDQG